MAKREYSEGLDTQGWLNIAKDVLIREGIEAVKIDRLANAANVTRGGFYWRFKSRGDLLNQLLADWQTTNTAPIIRALTGPGTPQERYQALLQLWIDEDEFIPAYDTAVRNWARHSPEVGVIVHKVDEIRMDSLRTLFLEAGYGAHEATVRARITYFLQVGYYALGVTESQRYRAEQADMYYRILTGFEPPEAVARLPRQRRGRPKA